MPKLTIIILTAGQGKRMQSELPKVLHPVGGRAMVVFPLLTASALKPDRVVFVVPPEHTAIRNVVTARYGVNNSLSFAVQDPPRGTGDAVRAALQTAKVGAGETVVILSGDMPFISADTLRKLLARHRKTRAAMTILAVERDEACAFGRVVRNATGTVEKIVEERDATAAQKKIREVNVGVYAFDVGFLARAVGRLRKNNAQGEYYLTDVAALAVKGRHTVAIEKLRAAGEAVGANTRVELAALNDLYYACRRDELARNGVLLRGHDIFVDADSRVAGGAVLESPCYVKGASVVGRNAVIETGCVLRDSCLAESVKLKAHCYVDGARVEHGAEAGPFAHLRPGTHLKENSRVGNFVEFKKSVLGVGSKANHLSYIGDATVGDGVNIGAGTITCNYDGVNKLSTVIEDGVFIGSDTQLVAPVKLGKGCYVGAGTTVTKDVSPGSLVVSRVRQREIPEWVTRRHKKMTGD